MARKAKRGDTSYNARRREYRAAQRYLKRAEQTTGATSERNRAIARSHLENALATYDPTQKQNISAPIINLAAEFGISIGEMRPKYADISESRKKRVIQESVKALENVPDEVKRENEAQALINNPAIAKRVFGGLIDIWRDKVKTGVSAAENRRTIESAIFEYFNTTSWATVFDVLSENVGEDMFRVDSDYEIYEYVKLVLQKHAVTNVLIK